MDPVTLAIMGGMSLLQNAEKAKQQRNDIAANAQQMQYTPWTGLAGQVAGQNAKAREFNVGEDVLKRGSDLFTTGLAQGAADKKGAADEAFRQDWLSVLKGQKKPSQEEALNNFSVTPMSMSQPYYANRG